MKKTHKMLSVLLAVMMVLSLAACGGGGDKDDPNLGKYMGDQINIFGWDDMSEVYEGENYLELKAGGKGSFVMEGDKAKMTWALEGENLTIEVEGEECTGTLKDGVIIIDLFGMDIMMSFVKEGATPPVFEG